MQMKIYTIFDSVAETSFPPFVSRSDAEAIRQFKEAAKQVTYPEDFKLYRLGIYNMDSMRIESTEITMISTPNIIMEIKEHQESLENVKSFSKRTS